MISVRVTSFFVRYFLTLEGKTYKSGEGISSLRACRVKHDLTSAGLVSMMLPSESWKGDSSVCVSHKFQLTQLKSFDVFSSLSKNRNTQKTLGNLIRFSL